MCRDRRLRFKSSQLIHVCFARWPSCADPCPRGCAISRRGISRVADTLTSTYPAQPSASRRLAPRSRQPIHRQMGAVYMTRRGVVYTKINAHAAQSLFRFPATCNHLDVWSANRRCDLGRKSRRSAAGASCNFPATAEPRNDISSQSRFLARFVGGQGEGIRESP